MRRDLDRRAALALGGAGLALGSTRVAQAAGSASLLDVYLATRGFRGNTAFWCSRGVRYALVGARFIPFQRSAVLEAVRLDPDGASLKSSALEAIFSFTLQGEPSYRIENPLTHTPVAIKPGELVDVDYRYQADGSMTLASPRPSGGSVRGGLSLKPGAGAPSITEAFEGFSSAPPVGEPALSEITVYKADAAPSSPEGVLHASKTVTVVRAWPYPAPDGVSARLLTLYEGRKFSTVDALVGDLGESVVKAAYPDLIDRFKAFS